MTKQEARSLKKGDKVVDSEGTVFTFIELDENEDLHVKHPAVWRGVWLYSEGCEKYQQ